MLNINNFLDQEIKDKFVSLIALHTGLFLKKQEQESLNLKIHTRMNALNLDSLENYYQLLNYSSPESEAEWQKLSLILTNNESYFFRDKPQFSLLKNVLLPTIIYRRTSDKVINICSAGCSTGEEAYSLAILLQEILYNYQEWHINILGIDINQEALNKAKQGIYTNWSFRGCEERIKQKYFTFENPQYSLKESIKSMVKFQKINLVKDSLPSLMCNGVDFDLIICRNVFIYFDQDAIAKVLTKFISGLHPQGYLLTGHTELANQDLDKFQAILYPESVVYQLQTNNIPKKNALTNNQIDYLQDLANDSINNQYLTPKYNVKNLANLEKFQFNQTQLNASKISDKPKQLLAEANELYEQKKYNSALEKVEQVLGNEVKNFEANYLQAKITANQGKYKTAIQSCQKALEINAFATSPYYLLAQIEEEQGNLEAAKAYLHKILYLQPNEILAYFELIHIYQLEGDLMRSQKMQTNVLKILRTLPTNERIVKLDNKIVGELIAQLELNKE